MSLEKAKKILSEPIQSNEIEWRVQQQTKSGDKIIIVPYINNRCVMERFDKAFGWDKWSNEFTEVDGGFICTIKIEHDNGFIIKSDGASKTKIEPVKGGISDSMKRAAVQLGLGRGLYDYPKVMIETTGKYIPNWAEDRLNKMVDMINKGQFKEYIAILKQK
jgi:hypothetical protein